MKSFLLLFFKKEVLALSFNEGFYLRLLPEIKAQLTFQRNLARWLGWRDALRFRSTMFASRRTGGKTIQLHPPHLLHPVTLRLSSTDAEVYGQVITAREYEAVVHDDAKVIVDAGANVGLTSAYFLSRLPRARVIAIEPFPENAEMCRRNLAPYGDRATVIEAALWSSCTRLVLDYGKGNDWGVRVRPVLPGEAGEIEAIDMPALGLGRIDILKIDIEGSEADLFAQNTQAWLPGVGNIAIELHGAACEKIFFAAMAEFTYVQSQSGELTICRNMSRK
jgi:FkbM family methyltransferase